MRRLTRVEGFRETERALAQLSRSTGRAVLRRVLDSAAEPIESAMIANAPELTGALKSNIGTSGKLSRRQASKARKLGKSEVERYVGTTDPAGLLGEFGRTGQPAKPWARPAWDAEKDNALNIVSDELGSEVERAAARAARRAAKAGR